MRKIKIFTLSGHKARTFINFYENDKCVRLVSTTNGLDALKKADSFIKSEGKFKTREVYAWTAVPAFKIKVIGKQGKDEKK